MNATHTGNMPWDNVFKDLGKYYTPPRIVKKIYKATLVKVVKILWNGEIIEEIIE